MPRKRKSDDTPSTDNTNVAPDSGAAETGTAVAEPPDSTPADSATATEPPVSETGGSRSFAERVGQKPRATIPDPFGVATDNLAGVRLFESRQDRQMAIKFGDGGSDSKPSQAVINRVKEAGYRWNPAHRVWTYPLRPDSAMSTRIEAEQLYQELRQMIREEKGIAPDQEVPF